MEKETLKKSNKNAVCKIIQTSWEAINKTISYTAVWLVFNWNFKTSLLDTKKTPILKILRQMLAWIDSYMIWVMILHLSQRTIQVPGLHASGLCNRKLLLDQRKVILA